MSYDEYNHTELVQMARMIDPNVTRRCSRDYLIDLIEGYEESEAPESGVDKARDDIYQMVDRYWSQVESLITCPMQTRHPRACYGCADIQIAECTLANLKLIEEVKKENSNE